MTGWHVVGAARRVGSSPPKSASGDLIRDLAVVPEQCGEAAAPARWRRRRCRSRCSPRPTGANAARARRAGPCLGAALQTGYLYALREGYDACAHLDADGQHPAEEVARLLAEVTADRADLVIGSRYHADAVSASDDYQPTFSRRIGTSVFRFFLTLATRQRFTDTTSGMRAANRRVMSLFSEHYSPDFAEIESLQLAVRQGLRVEEVPVRMLERAGGSSFLTPLRSAFFIFKGLVVLLVGQFRPRQVEAER